MKNKLLKSLYSFKFNVYIYRCNCFLIGYLINKNLKFFKRFKGVYFFFFKYKFFFYNIINNHLLIPSRLIGKLFSLYKIGLSLIIFFFYLEFIDILEILYTFNKKYSLYIIILLIFFENYVIYRKKFLNKYFINKNILIKNIKYFFYKSLSIMAKIA